MLTTLILEPDDLIPLSVGRQRAGKSVDSLRAAIRSGDLPGYRTSPRGHWRVKVADLDAWARGETASRAE
ncbi:helix-turn-helix domain-containing protein [Nocardioides sp. DS6]|uniref:Helix-turn-helix domain-containing protein n=1 Tax=Nocardioides eburneus TaxID=3231482 RepID=A0ABV3SY05_9ACTN